MRRWVSNTGPLLHLREASSLDVLPLLGEVAIPPAVNVEMILHEEQWDTERPEWLHIESLTRPYAVCAAFWREGGTLHLGEAEAVALAIQTQADWFLTDDAAARRFATSLHFKVRGSLGVVLTAFEEGFLNYEAAEDALNRLARSSLWIRDNVWESVRATVERLASRTAQ